MKKSIYIVLWVLGAFTCRSVGKNGHFIVAGYYPAWMHSTLPPAAIGYDYLTHVIHAFAWPGADGSLEKYDDLVNPELVQRAHEQDVKVLLALGGWGQCAGFAPMTAESHYRGIFIDNLLNFCAENSYDGVNLDWEYPASMAERSNLNVFVAELADEARNRAQKLSFSIAVPAGDWNGKWFDFDHLKQYVDFFCCMTYDFFGGWMDRAGHNSPLYPPPDNNNGSVSSGVQYLTEKRSLEKNKVLPGVPFYGRGCDAGGLNLPNLGNNVEYRYSEIIPLVRNGWNYFWDNTAKVPFLINAGKTKFISFDDTLSVRLKCEYIKEQKLAGLFIWALGQDKIGAQQPLLETVYRTMAIETKTGERKSGRLPETIKLVNYPNPFNGETTIEFVLQTPQTVTLLVLNLLGQVVEAPISAEKMQRGVHRCRFAGADLSGGVFICQLQTPSVLSRTRMLLLR